MPVRKEQLYKAKYDSREHVDYFVVEDTPKKASAARSGLKKTAHTQDTLGRLSSSRDREDSLESAGRPEVDRSGEYTIRVPDHDFVSFYDEHELPGPQQSAVPGLKKSDVQPPQKSSPVQRNTFFESQEDSLASLAGRSPEKQPAEKKKTNQFVSELVDASKVRSPESKKESVIINHIIKRDQDKPSAGFFLLKLEQADDLPATPDPDPQLAEDQKDPDQEPTGLRTPNRTLSSPANNVESTELLTKKEYLSFQMDQEDLASDSFEEYKKQNQLSDPAAKPLAAEPSYKKSQIRALFDELYVK